MTKTYRVRDVRGKEIDTSWPSGDATQASIFSLFMMMEMADVVAKIPG